MVSSATCERRSRLVFGPGDVLNAARGISTSIGRNVSDGARVIATIDAVRLRAGHRRGAAKVGRNNLAVIAVRNIRRVATERHVRRAGGERRSSLVFGPGDMLDAARLVTASVGGYISNGAGVIATINAIRLRAADNWRAAFISRRNLRRVAVRDRGRIATERHIRSAGRELRSSRVDRPGDLLDAAR